MPLVINDRIDIAFACSAHGMHLGQSDLPVHEVRKLLSSSVFIGWSVEFMADVLCGALILIDCLGVAPPLSRL